MDFTSLPRTLCDCCRSFFTKPISNNWRPRTDALSYTFGKAPHHTLESYEDCAQRCFICAKVLNDLKRKPGGSHISSAATICVSFSYRGSGVTSTSLLCGPSDAFSFEPAQEHQAYRHTLECSTFAESGQILAQRWLDECSFGHACVTEANPHEESPASARIIDVGEKGNMVCLTTANGKFSSHYMTLSHCWGNTELPCLTTKNLHDYQKEITIDSLPKTFRDAVAVTRRFGVRYLWIDCLCILQDSASDWRKESEKMGSRNPFEGLFFERKPSDIEPFQVSAAWPGIPSMDLYEVAQFAPKSWRDFSNGPLLKRAWVFQERLLARRTLFFGAQQLWWECNAKISCETFPAGVPASFLRNQVIACKRELLKGGHEANQSDNFESDVDRNHWTSTERLSVKNMLSIQWAKIVETYTSALLTVPSDKLLAMAGIADEFCLLLGKNLMNDKYIFGIWKYDLPLQLLCYVATQRTRTAVGIRIPSWSWVSVPGAVKFARVIMDNERKKSWTHVDLVTVDDVQVGTGSESMSGHLLVGKIVLRGKLVEGFVGFWPRPKDRMSMSLSTEHFDHRLEVRGSDDSIYLLNRYEGGLCLDYEMEVETSYSYLPLIECIPTHPRDQENSYYGIILQQLNKETLLPLLVDHSIDASRLGQEDLCRNPIYRRAGLFWVHGGARPFYRWASEPQTFNII